MREGRDELRGLPNTVYVIYVLIRPRHALTTFLLQSRTRTLQRRLHGGVDILGRLLLLLYLAQAAVANLSSKVYS